MLQLLSIVNLTRPRFIWKRGLWACMRGYLVLMEARDLPTVGGIIPWAGLNKKRGGKAKLLHMFTMFTMVS